MYGIRGGVPGDKDEDTQSRWNMAEGGVWSDTEQSRGRVIWEAGSLTDLPGEVPDATAGVLGSGATEDGTGALGGDGEGDLCSKSVWRWACGSAVSDISGWTSLGKIDGSVTGKGYNFTAEDSSTGLVRSEDASGWTCGRCEEFPSWAIVEYTWLNLYLLHGGISGDAGHELPGLLVAGHPGDEATGHTVCKEADADLEDDPTDTGEELCGYCGGNINDDGSTIGVVGGACEDTQILWDVAKSGVSGDEDGEDRGCFAGEAAGVWVDGLAKDSTGELVDDVSLSDVKSTTSDERDSTSNGWDGVGDDVEISFIIQDVDDTGECTGLRWDVVECGVASDGAGCDKEGADFAGEAVGVQDDDSVDDSTGGLGGVWAGITDNIIGDAGGDVTSCTWPGYITGARDASRHCVMDEPKLCIETVGGKDDTWLDCNWPLEADVFRPEDIVEEVSSSCWILSTLLAITHSTLFCCFCWSS